MTIQSINAYTPSKGADPKLDRTWATKVELVTGVGALHKDTFEKFEIVRMEIENIKEEMDKIKIVLNKLVQRELDNESI